MEDLGCFLPLDTLEVDKAVRRAASHERYLGFPVTIPDPPKAPRRPTRLLAHGEERTDPWYWLRNRDDPEVIALLEAENAYARAEMARTKDLQDRLYQEFLRRIVETDISAPVRKGPFYYFSRTVESKSYSLHCRCPASSFPLEGPNPELLQGLRQPGSVPGEEVILDENELAQGHPYFALGAFALSLDQRLLAYSVDLTGGERFELRIRDLSTGAELPDVIKDASYGAEWLNHAGALFYTRCDEAMRPYQLWAHCLGQDSEEDVLIATEEDAHFFLDISRTKDDRYIILGLHSKTTSELAVMDANAAVQSLGSLSPKVVVPRRHGIEASLEHHPGLPLGSPLLGRSSPLLGREGNGFEGDAVGEDQRRLWLPASGAPQGADLTQVHQGCFFLLTNEDAPDFRLLCAQDLSGEPGPWVEAVPHRPGVRVEGLELFKDFLVLQERSLAETRLELIDLATGDSKLLEQPSRPSTVWITSNPELDARELRYGFTSLIQPKTTYAYPREGPQPREIQRQEVPGYEIDLYETTRLWATSKDGTQVPISLVYRKNRPKDAGGPALLYGYGSYEISTDPAFSALRLSLLDRGMLFAIAHVRGGGENGRQWYEDGKLNAKHHSFEDFIACAQALIAQGWTSPEKLVARGGSAGGLLMGAVANQAPELFRAIVAEVPFVDCLTTMMDKDLPLTVTEWEEWGNPLEDPEAYRAMRAYSPYDNVPDTGPRYPDILATAGLTDPRVGFWEPAKWVQKLRAENPDNRVLLKVEMEAGHHGPSGRYEAWQDEAFVYAFILDAVGLGK